MVSRYPGHYEGGVAAGGQPRCIVEQGEEVGDDEKRRVDLLGSYCSLIRNLSP